MSSIYLDIISRCGQMMFKIAIGILHYKSDVERTKTVYTHSLAMSNTKTDLSSGKYRLKTVFTLTDKYGKIKTITVYSSKKSVGQKR